MLLAKDMSDFGSSFKKKRESMGLTLEQIANETRIGTRFLDAIEREDFQVLPGGIFSRGFIRSYAERLGMETEQAVAEFDRRANYKEPPVLETLHVSAPPPRTANKSLYPIAAGALLLVIVVAVFYVATRQPAPSPTVSQAETSVPAPVAATPAPAPEPAATPAETPVTPAEPPAATTETAQVTPQPPAPQPPTPPPSTQTTTPAAETDAVLTLVVEAKELTWVKVLGDRYVLMNENLQPGTTRRFTAKKSIGIITGNAGGLSLKLNDHEIRPLGKSGQIRQITITPENLKDFIS
jgi:cytoskeleton protein RodZ